LDEAFVMIVGGTNDEKKVNKFWEINLPVMDILSNWSFWALLPPEDEVKSEGEQYKSM
jgi:hypothetical protein